MNKRLVQMKDDKVVMQALEDRRSEILGAIADRTAEPTPELMQELAELDQAIGDAPIFSEVD